VLRELAEKEALAAHGADNGAITATRLDAVGGTPA